MIRKKYYENNGKTIYECDRCHKEMEGTDGVYRINIQNLAKSGKTVKSLHLCKRCTQISLAIVKKGVNKDK